MPTSPDDLVGDYLRALSTADSGLAVSLFTDDGIVHSPLYGARPAREFYPALFADTSQANLTLKSVMLATLAPDGKVKELHIVYDTVGVRPAFETEVGRASWRRPLAESP